MKFNTSEQNELVKKLLVEYKFYSPKQIENYDGALETQKIIFDNLSNLDDLCILSFGKYNQLIVRYEKKDFDLVDKLINNWNILENLIIEKLEALILDSERDTHLQVDYFQAFLGRISKDCFNGDLADTFLEFRLLETPTWDFWIKGSTIVHYQPAY